MALDNVVISGGVATLPIRGILLPSNPFGFSFVTAYSDIRDTLAALDNDTTVKEVVVKAASPGGTVAGAFETSEAITNFSKPIRTEATLAASAMYLLAAATDEIRAESKVSTFGSIGVAVDTFVFDEDVSVTSSNAPNKRPDLRTEEGKAVLRAELDQIEELFILDIANGRKMTEDDVKANFGRGGTMLAAQALTAGMIDGMVTPTNTGPRAMSLTLETLKADHPDLVAAIETAYHERIMQHLNAGESAGALELAVEKVKANAPFDQACTVEYIAAARKTAAAQQMSAQDDASSQQTPPDDSPEQLPEFVQVALANYEMKEQRDAKH